MQESRLPLPCSLQVTSKLWMIATCFAPISVQQNNPFLPHLPADSWEANPHAGIVVHNIAKMPSSPARNV